MHIKAHANRNKKESVEVMEQAVFYTDDLTKEITKNREKHLKKPLKETNVESKTSLKKRSTIDPESGWFHKGEHKGVFPLEKLIMDALTNQLIKKCYLLAIILI